MATFHPTVHPAMNKKTFHFKLFKDKHGFATSGHGWVGWMIVIHGNGSTNRNPAEILHVRADCRTKETTHLGIAK